MKRKTKFRLYVSIASLSVFAFFYTLTATYQPIRTKCSCYNSLGK